MISNRHRKAWRVKPVWSDNIVWDVVYASTASKARYSFLLALRDCCPDATFAEIMVRRDASSDFMLPAEHRLVSELSPAEREIVSHAFGGSGYRDHYCTAPTDGRLHRLAWELGLFSGPHGERSDGETPGWSGAFYYLTELGKHVALSMVPTYPGEVAQ